MTSLILFLQQVDIEEKIKNAPDKGYEIGVFIGSMLPFVISIDYINHYYSNSQ